MRKINLSGLKKYTIMFILLGLMVVFSLTSPYFFTLRNLTNIITQNTYFIIAAVGLIVRDDRWRDRPFRGLADVAGGDRHCHPDGAVSRPPPGWQ